MKNALFLLFLAAFATAARAQSWSAGAATGPFLFGDFMSRENRVVTPNQTGGGERLDSTLSADLRAGVLVYVERHVSEQLSLQLETTFTRSPLSIKTGDGDDGVSIDVGDMDATTFSLPVTWRFNHGGRFRPYLGLGPAYVAYKVDRNVESGRVPIYRGTRGEWGGTAQAGIEWWFGSRWGLRAQLADVITGSPFRESDFPDANGSIEINDTHNVHTSAGVSYRW